jgi:hypothetical protein
LRLSDEAIELADRHDIDERRLRHVVALCAGYHTEVVQQIIALDLTAKQVKELCESDLQENTEGPLESIPAPALKIARVTKTAGATAPEDIARALVKLEGDANLARARLPAMRKLLTDAEHLLADY